MISRDRLTDKVLKAATMLVVVVQVEVPLDPETTRGGCLDCDEIGRVKCTQHQKCLLYQINVSVLDMTQQTMGGGPPY